MKKKIEQKIEKMMNSTPVYDVSFEYGNEYMDLIGRYVCLASTKNKCVNLWMIKKKDEYSFDIEGEYCEEEVEWCSSIESDDPFEAFNYLKNCLKATVDRIGEKERYLKELYDAIK